MHPVKIILLCTVCVVYAKSSQEFAIELGELKEFPPNLYHRVKLFFKKINAQKPEVQRSKLNWFFDNQFRYVKYYGFYTVPLPNVDVNFKHKMDDLILSGNITLQKGLLIGLDLKRLSNVSLSFAYPIATVKIMIGYENVHYLYHYKADFMSVTRGGVRGSIPDVAYKLVVDLDIVELQFSLKKLELEHFGDTNNRFEGEVSKAKSQLFSHVISPVVESHIEPIVTKFTKNITKLITSWYNQYLAGGA